MAMTIETFYEAVGRLLSRQRVRELGHFLESAGVTILPEAFAGFVGVSCFLLTVLVTLLSVQILQLRVYFTRAANMMVDPASAARDPLVALLVFIASFVVVNTVILLLLYVILILRADSRRRYVETILPDFLGLAAANVRSGMSIDQALWYAAKPEFGVFSREVELVAKRTFGGESFNQALDKLSVRFNSKSVRRAVSLIKQGLASGGEMAEILERTAEDSRQMQTLSKEISASLLMYIIFILFAAAIGTPFLFGVSNKLIGILTTVFTQLPDLSDMPRQSSIGLIKPTKPTVTPEDFLIFTIAVTILTSTSASVIIGVIQTGAKKNGVKYIPFLVVFTLVVFLVVSALLDLFFSGMAGMTSG